MKRINKKPSLKKFFHLLRIPCLKKLLIERFYEHLLHFRFELDFVKFCNSSIEDFENLFSIFTVDSMPSFIEKEKVPFNSVKNLVANRHLYLGFENNESEEVNSTCNFVSGVLSEDNSNDSEEF